MTTECDDERPGRKQFKVEFEPSAIRISLRGFRFPASAWEERTLTIDDARELRDALSSAIRKAS